MVNFIVKNTGIENASPHHVSFHLSSDDVLTPGENGDVYVGEYFVSQGLGAMLQTDMLNHTLTIPGNTEPGTYYLFYSADGGQVVEECSELNNFATAFLHVSFVNATSRESWYYWFDNDYEGKILTNLTPGMSNYEIQKNVVCNFLPAGLHVLNFQFLDSNEVRS